MPNLIKEINELKVFEQKLNNQDSGNHELLNKIDLIEKENQTRREKKAIIRSTKNS